MKERPKRILEKIGSILPKQWWIILAVGILLLLFILLALPKILPNNNPVDLYAYYGISEDDTIVVVDTEQTDIRIIREEGRLYLPLASVNEYLNQRFYEDPESGHVLYTLPDRMDEFTAEKQTYSEGGVSMAAASAPFIIRDGVPYLSLEIIQKYTRLSYEIFEKPNRIWFRTLFDTDIPYRYAQSSVNLRSGAGYNHPVVSEEREGSSFIPIEDEGKWIRVFARDGHIGYVPKKGVGDPVMIQTSGAFFKEQEYGTDQLSGKISAGFDYIDDVSYGLDMLKLHLSAKEAVNVVVPTWFVLQGEDGEFTSCADPEYVELAHRNGLKVWVMIENITGHVSSMDLFSSRRARKNLIKNLVSQVEELGLDGINLDIESLTAESVPHYLEFIRELSMELNGSGVVLSADTYAPYSWNLKYDLPELAKLLDYVIIMGYDESWDTPGPNSDKDFITFCCEESLKVTAKEKLIIAVPFYTRGWAPKDDGTWSRSEINMKKSVVYLESSEDKEWLEDKGCWHGHADVDGVLREIWFEDPESSEIRIGIIAGYDVAGLAYWRLSQEDPTVWESVRSHGFCK